MAPSSISMQNISRQELYTSLPARIQYLHAFLDFSSRDIDALISGSKYIKQLIPAVVNIVYKKLLQYDITARAFTTRSTSYEGPIDEVVEEDSPQIKHRKMFLTAYLNRICSDPSKMEFWEFLDKVGMMHTGIGRVHPLHIEYIHIGVCLSFIQDVFTEAILSHPRISLSRKISIVKALGKVIWIQNDLFAKWYVRDGEEFRDEKEEVVIEKEGYLHGVKILDGDVEEMGGGEKGASDCESGEKKPGVCPFTGVASDLDGLKVSESPANVDPPVSNGA
ncbi:uncharacterized protein LY89DRAFT_673386 [Mollisia scopiformis]|uniref:Globin-sensor domain-containing protein n=1 Tax=Mollisia scopiformis TaxID=149040 RepID=A0A194WWU5_MOLSC|nr:uncharacterized protein LY89DRAFT_673386 [Mollisia scopiformis]KUJ12405.1 hypothetical protein LY89DRAFT_673386 [Mollisia scopiformis]